MKLVELDPRFFRTEPGAEHRTLHYVDEYREAEGIRFFCPKCLSRGVASHMITIRFARLPKAPSADEWSASGAGYDDLTLSPSIRITTADGCGWHGFVTAGHVVSI